MAQNALKSLFFYDDYRVYMIDVLGSNRRTGNRTELSAALSCQPSQLSQILSGKLSLSVDQSTLLSEYLGHNEFETQYLLYLVLKSRATSLKTKSIYTIQLDEIKKKGLKLKNQLKKTQEVSEIDQLKYYSHWKYSALHMLLPVLPNLIVNPMSERLQLSKAEIEEGVKFLVAKNFIEIHDGRYVSGRSHLHLGNDSELIRTHHTNWRLHSVQRMSEKTMTEGIHYSVLYSLSHEDFKKIRTFATELIKKNLAVVQPSAEETVAAFALDFYEI